MVRRIRYILEKYTINILLKIYDVLLEKAFQLDDWIRVKTDIKSPIALLISFIVSIFLWVWVRKNSV